MERSAVGGGVRRQLNLVHKGLPSNAHGPSPTDSQRFTAIRCTLTSLRRLPDATFERIRRDWRVGARHQWRYRFVYSERPGDMMFVDSPAESSKFTISMVARPIGIRSDRIHFVRHNSAYHL